jgi:hypothetical protein
MCANLVRAGYPVLVDGELLAVALLEKEAGRRLRAD